MELGILRKQLQIYKTRKGTLRKVSDEVTMKLLKTWEQWPGKSSELYRELGISSKQLANLVKKGKNIVKSGKIIESEFTQVSLPEPVRTSENCKISIKWENGKVIRFGEVDSLVEFLKKIA